MPMDSLMDEEKMAIAAIYGALCNYSQERLDPEAAAKLIATLIYDSLQFLQRKTADERSRHISVALGVIDGLVQHYIPLMEVKHDANG